MLEVASEATDTILLPRAVMTPAGAIPARGKCPRFALRWPGGWAAIGRGGAAAVDRFRFGKLHMPPYQRQMAVVRRHERYMQFVPKVDELAVDLFLLLHTVGLYFEVIIFRAEEMLVV